VSGETTVLPIPVIKEDLGRAVLEAARRGREHIPALDADDWNRTLKACLGPAGKGSWRAFMRTAEEVTLSQGPDEWILTRELNDRPLVLEPAKARSGLAPARVQRCSGARSNGCLRPSVFTTTPSWRRLSAPGLSSKQMGTKERGRADACAGQECLLPLEP
jgi:hypothetical protein